MKDIVLKILSHKSSKTWGERKKYLCSKTVKENGLKIWNSLKKRKVPILYLNFHLKLSAANFFLHNKVHFIHTAAFFKRCDCPLIYICRMKANRTVMLLT